MLMQWIRAVGTQCGHDTCVSCPRPVHSHHPGAVWNRARPNLCTTPRIINWDHAVSVLPVLVVVVVVVIFWRHYLICTWFRIRKSHFCRPDRMRIIPASLLSVYRLICRCLLRSEQLEPGLKGNLFLELTLRFIALFWCLYSVYLFLI
jgi:hypothetical protein